MLQRLVEPSIICPLWTEGTTEKTAGTAPRHNDRSGNVELWVSARCPEPGDAEARSDKGSEEESKEGPRDP